MTPVEAARTFAGVRFRHQGRNEYGLDCAGLVIAAYARLGVALKDVQGYGREPWKDGLREAIESNFKLSPDDHMLPGDILLFWCNGDHKRPQHIAMVTDRGMIHAHANVRKVVEVSIDKYWKDRIVGHYRP